MLAIDHVVLPVSNLDRAAAAIATRYGLASLEGGRHAAWGTANRIVPLSDAYIELVAVADPAVASHATFGAWVAAASPGQPLGWAVRTDSIDAIARRLGLSVAPGSRATPNGGLITWRSAGVEVAVREPELPFFIQWGEGVALPGATPLRHPAGPAKLTGLSLTGDPARLEDWLGAHDLRIAVTTGPPRLSAVALTVGERHVELRNLGRQA